MRKIDLEKEIERLEDKLICIQRRHDYMINELAELSEGLGNKPSWYKDTSGWNVAMQHKAALAIEKTAKMRLP